MSTPDIIIVAALSAVVIAIVLYLIKRRKKGGCVGCPHSNQCAYKNNSCPSQKDNCRKQ